MTAITIVTSTLNALPALQATARSIYAQSCTDWQWVVIDGASSDGTAVWLSTQAQEWTGIDYLSEPDEGVYEAWNKSLPHIRGEWVLFLGAGDRLHDPATLDTCLRMLERCPPQIRIAYGSVDFVDDLAASEGEHWALRWEGLAGTWANGGPQVPHHQGVFHRSSLIRDGAGFDLRFRLASDRAKLLPELLRNGACPLDLPVSLALTGGISSQRGLRGRVVAEIVRVNRIAGVGHRRLPYQLAALAYHQLKSWRFRRQHRSAP